MTMASGWTREPATCPRHGDYEATRTRIHVTGCPECRSEWDEAQNRRTERRERRERMLRHLEDAKVPQRFRHARIAHLEHPFASKVGQFVTDAINGRTRGPLIISGPPGTGKSHAAAAAIRLAAARTHPRSLVRYLVAAEYCDSVRACWRRSSERDEADVRAHFTNAAFLVIDDLGAGKAADLELLQSLICSRYDADLLRLTIITTNLAPVGFDAGLGQRMADRLREGASLIVAQGPSRRRPGYG